MKHKLSFLMPAHNEEKLISYALNRLTKVQKDYPNMEVLIGLDGCTDKTPQIVESFAKKHRFIKYFELNERKGKQAVLEKLEPYITGDIVIIHDADWIFDYKKKEKLLEFVSIFDNTKIGGIASGFAGDFIPKEMKKIKSIGYLASAWGNHFLLDYLKKKQTKISGNNLIIDKNKMVFPIFLDFYKRSALAKTKSNKNLRAGDHLERTIRLTNAGYDIVVTKDIELPRMIVIYRDLSLKDFIKQRIRGIISKGKIKQVYKTKMNFFNFHIPFFFYTLIHLYEIRKLRDLIGVFFYWFSAIYAIIYAKIISFNDSSVKEVWNLRMKR